MSCEFKIDEIDAILYVNIQGTLSFQEERAARLEAGHILKERHFQRLLVDLRELQPGNEVGTMECYDFGATYRQAGIPTSTRIAHVLPRDPVKRSNIRFVTTVAVNRGVAAKEFDDVDEARRWLLESKT